MQYRRVWTVVSSIAVTATLACNSRADVPPVSGVPESGAAGGSGGGATGTSSVNGMVTIEGPAPMAETIRMNSDPVCVKEATMTDTEYYIVGGDNGRGNVFVYVKEGISGTYPSPSETLILDQAGCRYDPHVFGLQVGQTVQLVNSDPTLHNIHATPAVNPEFNTGQPIQGMTLDRTFDQPEVMLPFKCDVHGWMNAYVGVLPHPFFDTTAGAGTFDISNLPAGDYVLEAWHEMLGTQTQNVTVADGETAEVTFTFSVG